MNEPLDPLKRSAYLLTLKCGPDATREEIERNYLDLCCKLRAIAEKNPRLKLVTDKEITKLTEAYEALIKEPVGADTVWFDTPESPTEEELERECAAKTTTADASDVTNEATPLQSEAAQKPQEHDAGAQSHQAAGGHTNSQRCEKEALMNDVRFLNAYIEQLESSVRALCLNSQPSNRTHVAPAAGAEKELRDFKATCAFFAVGLVLFLAAWLSHYDHLQADHKRLAEKHESQERSLTQGEGFKTTRPAVAIDLVPTDRPGIPLAPAAPTSKIDPAWFSKTKPIRVDWRPRLSEDPASIVARQWNRLEQERKQGRALARYADWLRAYDDWKVDNPEATSGEETQFMRDWYEQWDQEHPEPDNPLPDFS